MKKKVKKKKEEKEEKENNNNNKKYEKVNSDISKQETNGINEANGIKE